METGDHLLGMRDALSAFLRHAGRAGLDAPVPTTPGWVVRDLLAHQGMVHRWATGIVSRRPPVAPETYEAEGRSVADPVEWLHLGALAFLEAVRSAPDDLDTLVFLHDAPPARAFWARRQCHETTIHAVDALAASLGRAPRGVETWISREVALDGLDELLTGFLPRRQARLRADETVVVGVRPEDAEQSWRLTLSPDPVVTERDVDGPVDVELRASAVSLYLGLWNRSDEPLGDSSADPVLDLWRRTARVGWA